MAQGQFAQGQLLKVNLLKVSGACSLSVIYPQTINLAFRLSSLLESNLPD